MKQILTFTLLLFALSAFGQRLPHEAATKQPTGQDEIYTQADTDDNGTSDGFFRITFDSARTFFIADIDHTALSYAIDSLGTNVVDSLRGRFVLDSNGTRWYVDDDKQAVSVGGGGGGGSVSIASSTLTAGGVSCFVRYYGTAPSLAETATGTYTLTVPATTTLRGFRFTGDNTTLSGGTLTIVIDDGGTDVWYFLSQILNLTSNEISDHHALGIVIDQEETVAGTLTATFTNMDGYGATGFTILATTP